MALEDVKEISRIIFGVYSAKEIIDMAVCRIDNTKMSGAGSVYDERMGASPENNKPCVTCGKNFEGCCSHFGYIEFYEEILHPLFYKSILGFLRSFCIHCNRLLITDDQVLLCGLNKYQGEKRFAKILEKLEKIDICCHCGDPQPQITFSPTEGSFSMVYKEKICVEEDEIVNTKVPEYEEVEKESDETITENIPKKKVTKKKDAKISIVLSTQEIKKIFDSVLDSDIILCGLNPDRIHPRNLVLSVFPVLPPMARPFVVADGTICDDDLTNQISEIVKCNNIIGEEINDDTKGERDDDSIKKVKIKDDEKDNDKRETKKQKALQSLKFRVATYCNNSTGRAKHPTNGRALKGMKERLTGKDGQFRNNLMGKRVEFSSRTVIGPDPCLEFGVVGVPREVAEELTIPDKVTCFNIDLLSKLVNNGKANFVIRGGTTDNSMSKIKINLKYAREQKGTELLYEDIVLRGNKKIVVGKDVTVKLIEGDKIVRDGKELDKIYYPCKKNIKINTGDEVHRHLRDGDMIMFNRQPTLHRGSMMAYKTKILPWKTFRMNLATAKSHNADFDGDEMNMHVPQSIEARAELNELCCPKHHIISAQGSKPIMCIVQDSLTASYLMTRQDTPISKNQFFDICMKTVNNVTKTDLWNKDRLKEIQNVLKSKGKEPTVYNGRGLFSILLPPDFIFEKTSIDTVKIYRGVLYDGTLDKTIFSALIQIILKEYGTDVVSDFISNSQFVTNAWLLIYGFSIGLSDCLVNTKSSIDQIKDKISRCYAEADNIALTTHNEGIKEVRVTAALSKAKDIGMKIAKDDLASTNNLISTVTSGSKGDFFNIAQLTGLLGQQNLLGGRVVPSLNNCTRTLVHYPFGKLPTETEYESKGSIVNSFIAGLTPQEFFFHAMSGREGVCDTAMGTSRTGYIQRRIVKVCEDIQVKYDGTVRDTSGNIYQLSYGDTGYEPMNTVKVGSEQQTCDISRVIARLNLQHEICEEKEEEKRAELEKKEIAKKEKLLRQIQVILKRRHMKSKVSIEWSLSELEERLEALRTR